MKKFSAIIFDLGGVLLNLHLQKSIDAFKIYLPEENKSSIEIPNDFKSGVWGLPFFHEFEKGKISPSEFRNKMHETFSLDCSDEEIDSAWNTMLGQLPQGRVDFLFELKKNYRLFLLTNTNEIHWAEVEKIISVQYGRNVLEDVFEKIYRSSRVQIRKPEREIFELVLHENKLNADETIFIDDSAQHIEGAKNAGIKNSFLHSTNGEIEAFVSKIID